MASRKHDDNPSIASRTENRWTTKDEDKPSTANRIMPSVTFG